MGALITVSDLQMQNGEPKVEDLVLAGALGFGNPHDIRTLIKRHIKALQRFGEVSVMQRKPGSKGGRPSTVFYLNEEQSIFITAKSDTPRAAEITVEMVRVFRDYLADKRGGAKLPAPAKYTKKEERDRLYVANAQHRGFSMTHLGAGVEKGTMLLTGPDGREVTVRPDRYGIYSALATTIRGWGASTKQPGQIDAFTDVSGMLRDLYTVVLTASQRVEMGQEPSFASAMEGVLYDLCMHRMVGAPSGKHLQKFAMRVRDCDRPKHKVVAGDYAALPPR